MVLTATFAGILSLSISFAAFCGSCVGAAIALLGQRLVPRFFSYSLFPSRQDIQRLVFRPQKNYGTLRSSKPQLQDSSQYSQTDSPTNNNEPRENYEYPAIRHCLLGIKAVLRMTESGPEALAYSSLLGGQKHLAPNQESHIINIRGHGIHAESEYHSLSEDVVSEPLTEMSTCRIKHAPTTRTDTHLLQPGSSHAFRKSASDPTICFHRPFGTHKLLETNTHVPPPFPSDPGISWIPSQPIHSKHVFPDLINRAAAPPIPDTWAKHHETESLFEPLLKTLFSDSRTRGDGKQLLSLQQNPPPQNHHHNPNPLPPPLTNENPFLDTFHYSTEQVHTWVIPGYGKVRFTDYAPLAFKVIRERFGYTLNDLEAAIGACGSCIVEGSSGKSESVFVTTLDGRFKFKTLRGSEIENLRLFLPHYLAHVSKYPNTLLPRYLGLYTFEPPGNPTKPKRNSTSSVNSSAPTTPSTTTTARDGEEGGVGEYHMTFSKPFTIVLMANVFDTPLKVMQKYDFKGSTVGRQTLADSEVVVGDEEDVSAACQSSSKSKNEIHTDPKNWTGLVGRREETVDGGIAGDFQDMNSEGGAGNQRVEATHLTPLDLSKLTLKELDFEKLVESGYTNLLHVGNEKRALLKDQLEVDLDLLKRHGFMDYSLLVGIHKKPKIRKRKSKWRKFMASRPLSSLANLLVSFKSKAERSTPEPLPTADFKHPQVSVREEILTNSEGTERESAHDNIEASLQPADSWMGTVGNKMMSQLFAGSASRLGSDITDVSGSMKSSRSQLQLRSNENISNEAIAIDLTSILNIADDEENWNSEGAGRLDACRSSPAESRSTSPRYMTEEEEDESDEDCKEFDDKLPFSKQFLGGIRSEGLVSDSVEYEVYFVGLIDILQKFNFAKWVERGIQRKKHGTLRHTTSSVSPQSSLNSSGSGSTVPSSNAPSCPSILEEHASTSTSSSSSFQSICNLVNSESISPIYSVGDFSSCKTQAVRRSSSVSASLSIPEVSVEEPGRYAERLLRFVDGIFA